MIAKFLHVRTQRSTLHDNDNQWKVLDGSGIAKIHSLMRKGTKLPAKNFAEITCLAEVEFGYNDSTTVV